jgi:PAS domain-containing protein
MNREKILLLCVILILALMSWSLFSEEGTSRVRPGVRTMELPEAGGENVVVDFDLKTGNRDVFREPRETEPLEPLPLVLPPLDEMAILFPPPIPDSGADFWSRHLLQYPPELPGDIDELVTEFDDSNEEKYEAPTGESSPDIFESSEDDLLKLYDLVKINVVDVRWGRILNEDRYSLVSGRSTLKFQDVDPKTGADRFEPYTFAPDEYHSFKFADTLRNRIELKIRNLPKSSGSIPERLEAIAWLLEQADSDSLAFIRAESVAIATTELGRDDIQTWLALGDVWERTFQWDRAFSLYSAMAGFSVSREPLDGINPRPFARSSAPQARLGRILERLGMDQEAESQYREAAALSDGNPEVLRLLGELLTRTGRASEALPVLLRGEPLYRSRSAPSALSHGVAIGKARLANGDFSGATQSFREVYRAGGAAPQALPAAAGESSSAYLQGDFRAAFQLADDAISVFGADWRLLYMRGISAAAFGQPAGEVVRDLRAAVEGAELDAAPALAALAFWLNTLGHSADAQESLNQALQLSPNLHYARYLRARWARENHDLTSANEDLSFLISESPRCGAVLGELAWLLNQESRHGLASLGYAGATWSTRRAEEGKYSATSRKSAFPSPGRSWS